jgi:predicted polyphosphate/ATP-dependent NAD kinase
MSRQQSWERYESVARDLLDHFREHFGFDRVESKQQIAGRSGTSWEIDAKGVCEGTNSAVMLVECRQYRSKRLNQEAVAGLAYRITDTGTSGGIIVSPLPLQDGAKKVAEANNIIHVQLGPDSTSENFAIAFFCRIFVGLSDRVGISDNATAVLVDKDGNTRHYRIS